MKPTNTRKPIDIGDGAPIRCAFWARADAPLFFEECETAATEWIDPGEALRIEQWCADHPKAWIGVHRHGLRLALCDVHVKTWRDML